MWQSLKKEAKILAETENHAPDLEEAVQRKDCLS